MAKTPTSRTALRFTPGLVSGAGFAAMVDGLLFHELLQWHHFLSSVEGYDMGSHDGLQANVTADGAFHAFAVLVTLVGFVLLWRWGRRGDLLDGRSTLCAIAFGFAAFNIVDGTVLHLLLDLHHIREGSSEVLSDVIYLGLNTALAALALLTSRRGPETTPGRA